MLLVFDVAPGYMDSVQLPVQSDEDEETVKLRMLVEPPEDEDWASGHWNPTSFLCLAPELPSKASYCANVSVDRSRLSYGLATVVSATGEKVSSNQTSRQFEAHVAVDLIVARKGQHVTTTIGGEVIDENELAFLPVVWRIGASTGISKIEIIDEPEATVAPGDWPVTLDAAVAGEVARMSSTSKATLRGMRKEDMHQFRVGWGTELRERLGLARGNDALLEAPCGKGCAADAAAMAIMEATWARRLESFVRTVDLVARMSGDEFNVLLESVDQAGAIARARQIAAALAVPYQLGTHTVTSGASIGVVSSQSGFATTDDYLRAADAAMYQAKSHLLGVCALSKKGTEDGGGGN